MSSTKRVTQSRSSRAGTATPIPFVGVGSASSVAAAAVAARSASPTRTSRLQEKVELQNLNDRLAHYIDQMRNLENDNSRLTMEVQSAQETVTREVSNIKSMFEKELAAARKLLDEVSKEKAKLEIDIRRLWEENDEQKARLDKKSKELSIAENSARVYESRFNELNGKFNSALNDRKKGQDDAKEQALENARLRKQLDDMRKQLENETLARVDLENTSQSLREELSFKEQIHTQELTETRSRRQVEISEIDGRLSQKYEAKMQESLQELRNQYETQMRNNREEIELLYDSEIKNLKAAANRAANASVSSGEELRMNRIKIDSLNGRISELEKTNSALSGRIRELEDLLDTERDRHNQYVASLEAELNRMREEMTNQLQEIQDLMDIKVSLDLEIAAYGKLLCGEERRLNISAPHQNGVQERSSTPSIVITNSSGHRTRTTPARRPSTPAGRSSSVKRRRTVIEESEDRTLAEYSVNATSKGDVYIVEADSEGRFVKLQNKGTEEINITGWQLARINNENEFVFKFARSSKIDGGGTITVWSTDNNISHEPPQNIVMKKKWPVSDNMKTILMNADRQEIAVYERSKTSTSSHASRNKATGTGFTLGSSTAGVRSLFSLLF